MAKSKRTRLTKPFVPPPEPVAGNVDDDGLMDDLLNQLESRDQTVQQESAILIQEITQDRKKDPKSRFQARQARKAEALAATYAAPDPEAEARLVEEAKAEETSIKRICNELNVEIHEINPDGHCLFSAVGDQLSLLSIIPSTQSHYSNIRAAASKYILAHPDDFLPFLPSEETDGLMSPTGFRQYCLAIQETAVWGGEPEILALARVYDVPIHVVQGGNPPIVIHNPSGPPTQDPDIRAKRIIRISYHRKMYGLGEHYNSLRPKSLISSILK